MILANQLKKNEHIGHLHYKHIFKGTIGNDNQCTRSMNTAERYNAAAEQILGLEEHTTSVIFATSLTQKPYPYSFILLIVWCHACSHNSICRLKPTNWCSLVSHPLLKTTQNNTVNWEMHSRQSYVLGGWQQSSKPKIPMIMVCNKPKNILHFSDQSEKVTNDRFNSIDDVVFMMPGKNLMNTTTPAPNVLIAARILQ